MTRHDTTTGATALHRPARGRRLVGACALAAGLALSATGPALAASDSPTGGDVSGAGAESLGAASVEQEELTALFAKMEAGQVSPETYAAAAEESRVEGSTAEMMPVDPPAIPSSRALNLTHYAQNKDYWCGPAAGAMIIKIMRGGGPSEYNGASFTQAHLAGADHMRTEIDRATYWDSGTFTRGVNRWLGSAYYQQVNSPSAATMKSAIRSTIGASGRPVAADTVEFAGGKHYNGHPVGSTIGHWIIAYAYSNAGDTVRFADPSTSVWSGVARTFQADTSTFTGNYLQSNGIAY